MYAKLQKFKSNLLLHFPQQTSVAVA